MRTLVKWLAMGTGSVAVLLVLAVATVYAVSSYQLGQRHDEGRVMFNQRFMARVVAPNLTEVRGVYSDLDFVRMLRHGVRPDGRSAIPAMPSPSYTYLTDEDLAAIIAYVRSVPTTGAGNLPSTRLGLLVRFALVTGTLSLPADVIDHSPPPRTIVDREDLEGFGRYLSRAICTECHGDDLRGSAGFLTTPTLAVSMAYTGEQFREFLRTGIALGGRELEMMSAIARNRYASFTDHEIDALHAYLRTLAAPTSAGEP
jgi:mono/diheme cytochrome c family protein